MHPHWVRILCLSGVAIGIGAATAAEQPSTCCASLPLQRNWADDTVLPRPIGASATYYYQQQGYTLSGLVINNVRFDPSVARGTKVESRVDEWDMQVDAWILPFLNVFGILGHVNEKTDVRMPPASAQLLPQVLGGAPLPAHLAASPFSRVENEDNGTVYGGGMTLIGGWSKYWAAVTITRTVADLDGDNAQIEATTVQPKIGIHFPSPWKGQGSSVWFGGMYQKADETHDGRISLPMLGPVPPLKYRVEMEEEEAWNWQVGFSTDYDARWTLSAELGFGDRDSASVSIGCRF
jgi:hypothetical protein